MGGGGSKPTGGIGPAQNALPEVFNDGVAVGAIHSHRRRAQELDADAELSVAVNRCCRSIEIDVVAQAVCFTGYDGNGRLPGVVRPIGAEVVTEDVIIQVVRALSEVPGVVVHEEVHVASVVSHVPGYRNGLRPFLEKDR